MFVDTVYFLKWRVLKSYYLLTRRLGYSDVRTKYHATIKPNSYMIIILFPSPIISFHMFNGWWIELINLTILKWATTSVFVFNYSLADYSFNHTTSPGFLVPTRNAESYIATLRGTLLPVGQEITITMERRKARRKRLSRIGASGEFCVPM